MGRYMICLSRQQGNPETSGAAHARICRVVGGREILCHENPKSPSMSTTLKSLRALADPTRLRIVALLEKDELSVNELQEITRMGQSRISTHLGLLQDSGLVQSRREGKRTFYRLNPQAEGVANEFIELAIRGARELPEQSSDQINLKRILNRRREQ